MTEAGAGIGPGWRDADPAAAYGRMITGYAAYAAGAEMLGPCGYLAHGIAVVVVRGPLGNDLPDWMPWGTPYEWVTESIEAAAAASARGLASAILIDIDSHGGAVRGVESAADAVERAAAAARVVALVNEMAVSAAYWLIAGATEIVATPTAMTGGIGSLITLHDLSDSDNARRTITLRTGRHKRSPFDAWTEEHLAARQEEIDTYHRLFRGRVARGRGLGETEVDAMEGREFIGEAAVAARLADRVQIPARLLETLIGEDAP